MVLSFASTPVAPDTPQGPVQVDPDVTPTSEYTTEEVDNASSYAWYITPGDAGVISGNSTTGTVAWDPEYIGTATITVSAVNECGEGPASESLEVIVNVVGIVESPAMNNAADIYPNPADNVLNIKNTTGLENDLTVRIFNILGKKVFDGIYNSMAPGQVMTIDISSLPDGIYILAVTGQNYFQEKKLIIR